VLPTPSRGGTRHWSVSHPIMPARKMRMMAMPPTVSLDVSWEKNSCTAHPLRALVDASREFPIPTSDSGKADLRNPQAPVIRLFPKKAIGGFSLHTSAEVTTPKVYLRRCSRLDGSPAAFGLPLNLTHPALLLHAWPPMRPSGAPRTRLAKERA